MPKLDSPLRLSPVFKPKIWGRKDLSPLFALPADGEGLYGPPVSPPLREPALRDGPLRPPASAPVREQREGAPLRPPGRGNEPIGEVWITDDAARFMNGPLAGLTLAQAEKEYGPELHGVCWTGSQFPILAKYIYTSDWLSVQVHPDDDYARLHDPGNRGKYEMWYVVQAERGAEILLGVKPGNTQQSLKAAIESGTARELLRRFRPHADEAIFIPPGTVHALGPGLVLFEAEENSDVTYRLDDYGRVGLDGNPRPLHWAKGLEVTRVNLPSYRRLPQLKFQESFGARRYVLACRFFAVEELTLRKTACFEGHPQRVEVLSVLQGDGRVETAAGWLAYRRGETWLLPPATAKYRLVPGRRTRLLKFYLPDLDKDFRTPLARRGVQSAEIEKIVFGG